MVSTGLIEKNCGVEFLASKVYPYDIAWISKNYSKKDSSVIKCLDIYSDFSERFSYLIPGGEVFESINFNFDDQKNFIAERYGGRGVGANGGGARCGTIDGFQIKGIGKNPLSGEEVHLWHSYGGLHASDAIYEAVYSYILEKILPVGVASTYGIVITGKDSAYIGYEEIERGEKIRTWGALLVREAAARPAHFLPAAQYKPQSDRGICSDNVRVRRANQDLFKHLGGVSGFIGFMGVFLENCANQLAFSRMARIAHGSMAPSNLCLDGRWLDLTNTTFTGSGVNVAAGALPFFEEITAVIPIANEMIYTFSKYNGVEISTQPFVKYYLDRLQNCLGRHVCYIFLWDYDQIPENLKSRELSILANKINYLVAGETVSVGGWPKKIEPTDPIIILLKGLFMHEVSSNCGLRYLSRNLKLAEEDLVSICEAYSVIKNTLRQSDTRNSESFFAIIVRTLKRAMFVEFFFKGRLEYYINDMVVQSEDGLFRNLIDELMSSADWIFSDEDENITILSIGTVSIEYFPENGTILLRKGKEEILSWPSFTQARENLLDKSVCNLEFLGYDFSAPVGNIFDFMADMEKLRGESERS